MNINIPENKQDFPYSPREDVVQKIADIFLRGDTYSPRNGRYIEREKGEKEWKFASYHYGAREKKEEEIDFSPEEFNEALYACARAGYHVFRGYYKETYFYVKNNRDPRYVNYDTMIDNDARAKRISYV